MNPRTLLLGVLWVESAMALIEMSGFHCMMRHSMRMNRQVHGQPQTTKPPFEFQFLDSNGQKTSYYEPGKIYTVRLVGFVHYRGLLLQSRLTNENGFLIGSLKGGRFIETPAWDSYGIRLQECDLRMSTADSVTHSDDSRKFVTQLEWTSDKDIGAVQFMLTIAEEDEIYWERWRPRSGFIQPISFRGRRITIINEVFTDEKAAMRLADTAISAENSSLGKPHRLHGIAVFDGPTPVFGHLRLTSSERYKNDFEELRRESDSFNSQKNAVSTGEDSSLSRTFRPNLPFSPPSQPRIIPQFVAETKSTEQIITSNNDHNTTIVLSKTMSTRKPAICKEDQCKNGAKCVRDREGIDGFLCDCAPGWTGIRCEGDCGVNFCKHNGTCTEKRNGELGCKCPSGSAGEHCERGPCQDIYGSCKLWQRQGQCELMRYHTNFYDLNCAVSCEQCTANNSTALTKTPIPTTLLPLAWMLGVWKADVNGTRNNTIDFPFDFHSNGYVETLTISLQTPLMFGTPSINFTSIAISKIDPRDQHIMNGFLSIRNRPEETPLVAISSVSNSGTILIEEGELLGTSMILKPRYQFSHPLIDQNQLGQMSRTFLKNGKKLLQSINRKRADGRNDLVNKHYKKIEVIQYL
ncbi:unnamed protein product [Anisakis simplex]|uniref:Uncharacterized protein n=1 Tax=Anisakis simplex TaxID=6269 RepID=A0A0M3JUF0_ANISI|nr:unnamed protein product [Anisakis simplex]